MEFFEFINPDVKTETWLFWEIKTRIQNVKAIIDNSELWFWEEMFNSFIQEYNLHSWKDGHIYMWCEGVGL